MNKNDIIKYLAIAGGAYALYWYLTNYGPSGAVTAGGVSWWNSWFGGSVAAPATTTTTTTTNGSGAGAGSGVPGTLTPAQQLAAAQSACVAPNTWNSLTQSCAPAVDYTGTLVPAYAAYGPGDTTAPNTGAPSTVETAMILQNYGGNASDMLTATKWASYRPMPLSTAQFSSAFPGAAATTPMNLGTFMNALYKAGLAGVGMVVPTNQGMGDVVGVGSRPSIPTGMGMAFGGRPIPSMFRTKETVN